MEAFASHQGVRTTWSNVALTGTPGPSGCMGAKEFWGGYDWPWNTYHELNVDFCGDSKNRVLVLHGRGKPASFRFRVRVPLFWPKFLQPRCKN